MKIYFISSYELQNEAKNILNGKIEKNTSESLRLFWIICISIRGCMRIQIGCSLFDRTQVSWKEDILLSIEERSRVRMNMNNNELLLHELMKAYEMKLR